MSALVAPLVQSRPTFVGWDLSPDALTTVRRPVPASLSMSSSIPHPTPQYEQTVFTVLVAFGPDGVTAAPLG